jgi:hypothetical protein
MVDELLADSFLRRLFSHFYENLATAPGVLDPALKVLMYSDCLPTSGHLWPSLSINLWRSCGKEWWRGGE